jgi:hypothetical protein
VFTSDEPQLDDDGVSIGVVSIELDRCSRCGDPKRVRTSGYVPRHARVREDEAALADVEAPAEIHENVESPDAGDALDAAASVAAADDIKSAVREPANAN